MRILWHSNAPFANTGYGSQTRLFTPRIRDAGHEVSISAYWGLNGTTMAWEGMTVFPGDEAYGNRLLPALVDQNEPDVVITLMDVWVLTAKRIAELPLACWTPVDHEPAPPRVKAFFERTGATPIAMSKFGERMLVDDGLEPLYVPHAVDTRVYRPTHKRAETRARMGISEDAFVVGMVAANNGNMPSRKAFPQVLQAFARLRAEHEDAYLYLHTDATGAGEKKGVNLGWLAESLSIPDDAVRFTKPLHLELGMPDAEVADLYSAFDVLANPSYGEGFGVPIIEAQACGTRVIVTDCTAMTELCGPGSWLVEGEPWFDNGHGSFYKCPSIDSICDAMRAAYDQRTPEPDVEARRFALDYDVEVVMRDYWRPVLATLGGRPRPASALILPDGVAA